MRRLPFGDGGFRLASRQLRQMIKFPGEEPHAVTQRTDLNNQIGQRGDRHIGLHLVPALPTLFRLNPEILTAPRGNHSLHPSGGGVGRGNHHMVDRLEQDRPLFRRPLDHRQAAGGAECHFRTVDAVVGAIGENDLEIDHLETERAAPEATAHAVADRRDEVSQFRAANHGVGKI